MKKCTQREHKIYLQTKRSEFFIGDFKSFATHKSSKITLLLWSCAISLTEPDKSNVKLLIFVGQLCLILPATQILPIAFCEI